jgi:hypothetical protein
MRAVPAPIASRSNPDHSATSATAAARHSLSSRWTRTRLFFVAFSGYMLFFGGHFVTGDNAQRIAWAKALLDHGSNDISSYFPGLHYTKYGIGASLLHIPFLIAARVIKRLTGISCEGPLAMLLYELNAALGLMLIFLILTANCAVARADAFFRTLVIGFTTVWLPYSKVDYAETLAAVALLGVFYFADSMPLIAGLCGAWAIMLRSDSLPWLFITALFATRDRKALMWIAAGAAPGLLLTFWANYARTGDIFNSGYELIFDTPLLTGVYGLLFSAGKSALLFSPLLILYPSAIADLWHSQSGRRLAAWSLTLTAAQLCFFGKWWDWSGEDSWGPRLIIYATLAALIVIAASDISRTGFFTAAAIIGFFVQLPPVLIGPHTTVVLDRLCTVTVSSNGDSHPLTLDETLFIPAYSQLANTANLLLLKIAPQAESLRQTAWVSGINPPIDPHQFPVDLFWFNPPHHSRPTILSPRAPARRSLK